VVAFINCHPSNLTLCTAAESSRISNVRFEPGRHKKLSFNGGTEYMRNGRVQIGLNSEKVYLGLDGSEEEAAHAHNAAALELHGEFAKLNFFEPSQNLPKDEKSSTEAIQAKRS
jgi:hypothetical protein